MFTPAEAIAELDAAILEAGETVKVTHGAGAATVKALVRGFKPDELVGTIVQGDSRVVLSPTGLGVLLLPLVKGDKIVIAGQIKNVQGAEHIRMGDVLVRINVQVRGF